MSLWLKNGVDVAAAESAAATFRGRVDACIDVVFVRQAVVFSGVEVPAPTPLGDTDGTQVGVFIFSDDAGEYAAVELHGIKSSLLMTTGPGAGLLIDLDNADVAALVAELVSGLWCNPFGYPLTTLESAYLQIRR